MEEAFRDALERIDGRTRIFHYDGRPIRLSIRTMRALCRSRSPKESPMDAVC